MKMKEWQFIALIALLLIVGVALNLAMTALKGAVLLEVAKSVVA